MLFNAGMPFYILLYCITGSGSRAGMKPGFIYIVGMAGTALSRSQEKLTSVVV